MKGLYAAVISCFAIFSILSGCAEIKSSMLVISGVCPSSQNYAMDGWASSARSQRLRDSARQIALEPDRAYFEGERFLKEAQDLKEKGCTPDSVNRFFGEWDYVNKKEKDRQAGLAKLNKASAEKKMGGLMKEITPAELVAIQHGFKLASADGLLPYLLEIRSQGIPIEKVTKSVAQSASSDFALVAIQSLGKGSALFSANGWNIRVIVEGYSGDIYEGSYLSSLRPTFWRVIGTRNYANAAGGSSQAFLVRPAW
jgi:hypothetical protein